MTEEVKNKSNDESIQSGIQAIKEAEADLAPSEETTEQVAEEESSPLEDKAKVQGYLSEEAFNEKYADDPSKVWVSPEEYLYRGDLFENFNTEKHLIKNHESRIDIKGNSFEAAKKAEYLRAFNKLSAERDTALLEQDETAAASIKQDIDTLHRDNASNTISSEPTPQVDPAYTPWVQNGNDWYEKNPVLRAAADNHAEALQTSGKSYNNTVDFYNDITSHIKESYPKYFNESTTSTPKKKPNVLTGRRSGGKQVETAVQDLSPEYQEVYRQLTAMGLNGKDLIKDWKPIGAI